MPTESQGPAYPEPVEGELPWGHSGQYTEERVWLLRQLYLMYQHQPRAGLDNESRRQKAAYMRYQCRKLGIPTPSYLKGLHGGVSCTPKAEDPDDFDFHYADEWDSPHTPISSFPE